MKPDAENDDDDDDDDAENAAAGATAAAKNQFWTQFISAAPPATIFPQEQIFCHGPLLLAVQMSRLYSESKVFVDKKLQFSPDVIIRKFDDLLFRQNGKKLTLEQIKKFIEDNFEDEGCELETWVPEDWSPEPEFIYRLKDYRLRRLARSINQQWKNLSRKITEDVAVNSNLYSFIPVPNGFILPGEKFREFYYWDSYWIVKGLLHCDMTSTVKGIIENFVTLINVYGYIPVGPRVYYRDRSQPPFLTLMIKEYINKTADLQFLRKNLGALEEELEFWRRERSVLLNFDGKMYSMYHYGTNAAEKNNSGIIPYYPSTTRPEMLWEDFDLAGKNEISDDDDHASFFRNLKVEEEAGFKYPSSRFTYNNHERGNKIIPVDLNSLMYVNYNCTAEFYCLLGDADRAELALEKAENLKDAINAVLWDESEQMWFDFDFYNDNRHKSYYSSNLFPLWAECYDSTKRNFIAECCLDYLTRSEVFCCEDEDCLSLAEDINNLPLHHVIVTGLWKTECPRARAWALCMARSYTKSFLHSSPEFDNNVQRKNKFNNNNNNLKNDENDFEFAWINGVLVDFIVNFGDDLLPQNSIENFIPPSEKRREIQIYKLASTSLPTSKSPTISPSSSSSSSGRTPTPEKHELEASEKFYHEDHRCHPALGIEEDGDEDTTTINSEEVESDHHSSFPTGFDIHYRPILEEITTTTTYQRKVEIPKKEAVVSVKLADVEDLQVTNSKGEEFRINEVDLRVQMPPGFKFHPELISLVRNNSFKMKRKQKEESEEEEEEENKDRIFLVEDELKVRTKTGENFDLRLQVEVELEEEEDFRERDDYENSVSFLDIFHFCSSCFRPWISSSSSSSPTSKEKKKKGNNLNELEINYLNLPEKSSSMNNMDLLSLSHFAKENKKVTSV